MPTGPIVPESPSNVGSQPHPMLGSARLWIWGAIHQP